MVHTDRKELREYKIDRQAVCKGKEKYRTEVGLCKITIWSLLLDPNCMMLSLNTLDSNLIPGLF